MAILTATPKSEVLPCLSAVVRVLAGSLGRLPGSIPKIISGPCVAEFGCEAVSCLMPLGGWRSRNPNDSGKYPVTFRMRDGWIDQPIEIPCGKCIGCKSDKATAWGIRAYHESTRHKQCAFVTFTYDDQHMPVDGKVSKYEAQCILKRMRNHGLKFRYMLCGEYGGVTKRPHYHALIFGQDFRDDAVPLGVSARQVDQYSSRVIDKVWDKGFHVIEDVNAAACFYVAGYLLKNNDEDDSFLLASRKPYIGHGWLSRFADHISQQGFVTIDGKKRPIPPSYLQRPEFALEFDALKDERREFVKNRSPDEVVKARESARGKGMNLLARSKLRSGKI